MRRILQLGLWVAVLMAAAHAEVVDRTIAVVNHHVLTWSDLDEQMRFEALENGREWKPAGEQERRTAFYHLVEARILRDQTQGLPGATAEEVEARIAEIRATWKLKKDDQAWEATLERFKLSAAELRTLVGGQIEILRVIDFRVRPLARVTRSEIEDYYSTTLAPQVMARGQKPEPLEDVREQIRELLIEQKTTRETEKLLQNLRSQSNVKVLWDGVK
jgi:hypothetical protein